MLQHPNKNSSQLHRLNATQKHLQEHMLETPY